MLDACGSRLSRWRVLLVGIASLAVFAVLPAVSHAETGSSAVAWGQNLHTQLDAGYRDTFEDQPIPVVGLHNIKQLASGSEYGLALLSNGEVRAWGDDQVGALGDGENGAPGENWEKLEDYVTVNGLEHVTAISSAGTHSLALLENGTVEAWGNNWYGEQGNGTLSDSSDTATLVPGLEHVIAIASGGPSNYALLSNHTVVAWGENTDGQLGIGEIGPQKECHGKKLECAWTPHEVGTPVLNEKGEPVLNGEGEPEVTPLKEVAAISAGEEAGYALLKNGHLLAWGANFYGQLGTGASVEHAYYTPTEVKNSAGEVLENVTAVAGGEYNALALLSSGKIEGWGRTWFGDIGEVTGELSCAKARGCINEAQTVKGVEHVSAIATGEGSSLALSEGKVYGFGENEQGELGDGNLTSTSKPTLVEGIGKVTALSVSEGQAGQSHSMVLLEEGVEQPAPLLTIEPKVDALKLSWKSSEPEYEVILEKWTPEAEECEEGCKPIAIYKLGSVSSYEITGLEADVPYRIIVKAHNKDAVEKKRVIEGTPLS